MLLAALLAAGVLAHPDEASALRTIPFGYEYGGELPDSWWYGGDEDFLVATIVSVRDSGATNLHPPRVTILVDEVLRGRVPHGELEIEWPAVPLSLLCGVGAGPIIRSWEQAPLHGPRRGQRMILGGHMGPAGRWWSDGLMRWSADDAHSDERRRKIREWTPRAVERQRAEQRAREEKALQDRADRERAARELVRAEQAWFAADSVSCSAVDLDALVRASDAVLLSSSPAAGDGRGAWGRFMKVAAREWLLAPPGLDLAPGATVDIVFGAREDTLARRWRAAPADDRPGAAVGDSLTCLVFVRHAGDAAPPPAGRPLFRPADPLAGIVRADAATVRAVRAAIARRDGAPVEPIAACGAPLHEFLGLDSVAVASVALKLSAIGSGGSSVVLAGSSGRRFGSPATDPGWFSPCSVGDRRFAAELRDDTLALDAGPVAMRELLDSLATIPVLAAGHADSADSLALTLRRVVDGRERLYEATLDPVTRAAVCRAMAAVFRESAMPRWNLPRFWNRYEPALATAWQDRRPAPPRAPERTRGSAALSPGSAALVGVVVNSTTGAGIPGCLVRSAKPARMMRSDGSGLFVLGSFPAGANWIEIDGPDDEVVFARVDLPAGAVDAVTIPLLPAAAGTGRPGLRVAPPVPFLLPALDARVTVGVRGEDGAPMVGARVELAQGARTFAGFADASGRITFGPMPTDRYAVVVRAPDHAVFRGRIGFLSALPDTLQVVLPASPR